MRDETTLHYDAVIAHQHARIAELEAALSAAEATLAAIRAAPAATQPHHLQMLHHAYQLAQLHRSNYQGHVLPLETPALTASSPRHDLLTSPQPTTYSICPSMHANTVSHSQTQTLSQTSPSRLHPSHGHSVTASQTRYWTELEHNRFLRAVQLFGAKNYVAISNYVGSRTPKQVRSHSQKYQLRLEREARKRATPPPYYSRQQLIAPAHHALLAVAASEVAEREAREKVDRELKRRRTDGASQSSHQQSLGDERSDGLDGPDTSQLASSTPHGSQLSERHPSQDELLTDESEDEQVEQQSKQQQSQNCTSVPVSFAPRKRRPWRTSSEGIAA